MNFTKNPLRAGGLLLMAAALLSIPVSAVQDVNPDHFDDKPAVVKKQKPATSKVKPTAAKKSAASSQAAPKAKAAPARAASLRADSVPVQTAANPR